MQSYEEFLESKVKTVPNAGFEPSGLDVLPLFDFQRAIVEWATRKQGRRFLGIELKPSYFDIAARHLRMAEMSKSQPSLFDEVPA